MIFIHQALNRFSFVPVAGEGWESLSVEAFNALRASGFEPVEYRILSQDTDTVLRRLSVAERAALFAARQAHAEVDYLVTRATATGAIRETDPDFSAAVVLLDELGIVPASRWAALLAP